MTLSTRYKSLASMLMLAMWLAAACADPPTAPPAGRLNVSTSTSGADTDDSYDVVIGATMRRTVRGMSRIGPIGLVPGTYSVALEGVAPNCSVRGLNPRSVTITGGEALDVGFEVVCAATGIRVTANTVGPDSPLAFPLFVNGQQSGFLPANGVLQVSRLTPGGRSLRLAVPDHCTVAGGNQLPVDVTNAVVTGVSVSITCVPVVRREKIAYEHPVTGSAKETMWISLVNPDGSAEVEVVEGHSPSWSPDGTRLIFSTTQCDTFYYFFCSGGLMIVDPDSWRVTSPSKGAAGEQPAWSPSGDGIAFVRLHLGFRIIPQLFVMRPDGSDELLLFSDHASDPSWAPDGQRIAFTCTPIVKNTDICVVKRDGTGYLRLTSGEASEHDPAWSPDGRRIAFTTFTSRPQITVMAADGSGVTMLGEGRSPAWSRDGTRIVFTGNAGLFVMNADGTNVKRLTTGLDDAPAWRP